MADANRTAIRVSRETSAKTLFANPLFHPLRITSASLAYTPETVTSNEIDDTRQINDQPLVGFTSGGDIPTEFSIGNTDALTPGLMMNEWVRSPEVLNGASWKYGFGSAAANRIISVTNTTITLAATSVLAGTSVNQGGGAVAVGHLLYLTGFGMADQLLRATASAATTITVAGAVASGAPPVTSRIKVVGFEGAAGDVTAITNNGNALGSTTLNFTQMGLSVGQWVFLGGRNTTYGFAAFGGWARISAIAAQRLSFDVVPTGFQADAAAGKTIRVFFTDYIRNGVLEDVSYQVEEQFGLSGNSNRFLYHRGLEVNSRVLNADTKAIITDSWNFMGLDALPLTAVRTDNATTLTAATGSVLNSSTAIPAFYEGGTTVGAPNFVNSFSLSVENNKRARDAVGILGSADIGTGRINVTGTLNTYFGDETLYNKVIANTVSSLTVVFNDPAMTRAELHDIPRLKYSSGAPDVTGIDTDIFVPLAFQGLRDIANGRDYTYSISKFEYYA